MIIQCWADFQNGWNLIFFYYLLLLLFFFFYLLCHTSGTHIESQKELNHRITKNLWVTIHQHKIFVLYALPISFSENQTVKQ